MFGLPPHGVIAIDPIRQAFLQTRVLVKRVHVKRDRVRLDRGTATGMLLAKIQNAGGDNPWISASRARRPSSARHPRGSARAAPRRLAREGVDVTICARGAEALNATAKEMAATGAKVTPVVCDVTTEAGRKALLAACPNPDILINNAGGPPPGDFKDFSLDDWRKAVEGNMLTPIALIHATVYGMMRARLRPHRQHHVRVHQSAHRRARAVERRAAWV